MRTLISILSLLLLTCGLTSAVNLTDLTGCRSNSGLFVPIGSGYFKECNSCTCGENGQSICTLMACTTGACWNDQGKQITCDVASWFSPLVITTVGDSKINVPSDYAIVRANIESELSVKVKEKESIVIGSGVGSVPATLPALIPAAAASAAVGVTVPTPTPSTSNATVVNATIIHAPPAASNYTDIMTKVQQDVADKTQAVLDYLKKQGKSVWKIETQQVSVYPVYDYAQVPLSMVAYHASISLSFRVTVLHAGTVIDGITGAGVSRINDVSYGVSDDKIVQAEKSAIAEAVENALERAQVALNAAKKEGKNKPTLNPIDVNIQYVGTAPNYPRPLYSPIAYDKAASSGSATTPILAQETVVTANVIAKFEAK